MPETSVTICWYVVLCGYLRGLLDLAKPVVHGIVRLGTPGLEYFEGFNRWWSRDQSFFRIPCSKISKAMAKVDFK